MQGGLVLIPAGFLKRADVWPVFDQTEWPGYDNATTLAMNQGINDQDAYGVLFTRIALQAAGLLRTRSGIGTRPRRPRRYWPTKPHLQFRVSYSKQCHGI